MAKWSQLRYFLSKEKDENNVKTPFYSIQRQMLQLSITSKNISIITKIILNYNKWWVDFFSLEKIQHQRARKIVVRKF